MLRKRRPNWIDAPDDSFFLVSRETRCATPPRCPPLRPKLVTCLVHSLCSHLINFTLARARSLQGNLIQNSRAETLGCAVLSWLAPAEIIPWDGMTHLIRLLSFWLNLHVRVTDFSDSVITALVIPSDSDGLEILNGNCQRRKWVSQSYRCLWLCLHNKDAIISQIHDPVNLGQHGPNTVFTINKKMILGCRLRLVLT